MADVAVENLETPVVEKEVEDVDAPKVVDDEVVENGSKEGAADEEAAVENGTSEADAEAAVTSTPAEEADEAEVAEEAKNGDAAEAPEAVKRKADVESVDAPSADDAACPTPEKKSKLDESATENGSAEEVAA